MEERAVPSTLVHRLAERLYADHARTDASGFCVTCREFAPCGAQRLAKQALTAAQIASPHNAARGRYRSW
jgi:hypothetical protein